MIDYLERIFAPASVLSDDETGEQPMAAPRARLKAEEPEGMNVPKTSEEAYWQEEAVRRIEHALTGDSLPVRRMESIAPMEMRKINAAREEPEAAGSYSADIRRQDGERSDETLERRLRRDSRRYDSGFFWY